MYFSLFLVKLNTACVVALCIRSPSLGSGCCGVLHCAFPSKYADLLTNYVSTCNNV